ncbi:hypothetical protein Trisim1_009516 [Trichoderma cf. simile WF8]
MAATDSIVYHGNCHCGRYRFQKGYLWLIPGEGSFTVVRDEGYLVEYQTSTLKDKFCSYCGTGVEGEHLTGPLRGKFLINIRTLREPYVNPFKLESAITIIEAEGDARSIEPLSQQPDEPAAKSLFACHCGHAKAALLSPIEEEELKEDNCSKCVRIAYIGIYPTKDNVRIYGRDQVFEYLTGGKFTGSTYCKTCGVHVFSNIYGPPISVFDKLSPERKERALAVYHKNMAMQPLNVRAIEGAKVDTFQPLIKREDEGTDGYELDS